MIKFTGVMRWIRNIESKRKPKTLVGVEYVKIDVNDKINILSYALKINRRKNFIKLSLIVLSILIIATSVWGIRTTISKQKVEKELKFSEDLRSRLEIDIKALSEMKAKIDKELVRQRYKIKETNEKLAAFKNISEELQERIYVYTIISDQDVVFLTSKSNTNILDDENYKKARIEMTNNRCAEAATYFQLAVDKNPDSPIGYSGLIRAYNCLKDYKKSKEIFDIYLKFQKKELESK
jgi:tetratricopeptide (TPR) repeat protein